MTPEASLSCESSLIKHFRLYPAEPDYGDSLTTKIQVNVLRKQPSNQVSTYLNNFPYGNESTTVHHAMSSAHPRFDDKLILSIASRVHSI